MFPWRWRIFGNAFTFLHVNLAIVRLGFGRNFSFARRVKYTPILHTVPNQSSVTRLSGIFGLADRKTPALPAWRSLTANHLRFLAFTLGVIGHSNQHRLRSVFKRNHTQKYFIDVGGAGVAARQPFFVAAAAASERRDARRLEEHVVAGAELLSHVHTSLPGQTLRFLPLLIDSFEYLQAVRVGGKACKSVRSHRGRAEFRERGRVYALQLQATPPQLPVRKVGQHEQLVQARSRPDVLLPLLLVYILHGDRYNNPREGTEREICERHVHSHQKGSAKAHNNVV